MIVNKVFILAFTFLFLHITVPILYYYYLKTYWYPANWNISIKNNFYPKILIILPTFNEADYIYKKLDNIRNQDYPKTNIKIIVIDSGSTDGTSDLVKKWMRNNKDINIILIKENKRRGKLKAVLTVLSNKLVKDSDIVVLTDADAFWDSKALLNLAKYFSDPTVAVVTGSIAYINDNSENIYRNFYNIVRVSESKIHSTPIHNGPLQAFKREIIEKIGLPTFAGADDSSFASYIAFAGFRAIQVDDVFVYEVQRGNPHQRKIRRAQHVILNFLLTKKYAKKKKIYKRTNFEIIWRIEWFLTIINPWFLLISSCLMAYLAFTSNVVAIFTLILGALSLIFFNLFKMWVFQQIYLLFGFIKNFFTRSEIWEK